MKVLLRLIEEAFLCHFGTVDKLFCHQSFQVSFVELRCLIPSRQTATGC